jgi:O-methyltransferase involved in polyketide biosynthesis
MGVLYWQVAETATLEFAIGKTMGKRRYKLSTTTPNFHALGGTLHSTPAGKVGPMDHPSDQKADASILTGVSETALLTLNSRTQEARRPDAIINDPMAVRLADSIEFDFTKFGRSRLGMALRALSYDRTTAQYLTEHPAATVVALAEGLQTSFWRLSAALPDAQFSWLTVDLPPIIELRERLLPTSPRITNLAQSALDYSWMDAVDASYGVFITAEGLLMYLQPEQSIGLITECAKRFPGGQMMFDLPPDGVSWWTRRGMRMSLRYKAPPMPFSLSVSEIADLVATVSGIKAVRNIPPPKGRRLLLNTVMSATWQLPVLERFRAATVFLEFG